MAYSVYEESLELGTPIELYEFDQGLTRWYFVSGTTPITRAGKIYKPTSIKRDLIKQTSDAFKDSLKLSFPRGNAFAVQYIGFAPEEITTVTVLRGHYGDPNEEFIVYWKGRVIGAKASGNTVELACESVFTSIKRPGLRARFEYSCRHTLYQSGCNVSRGLYEFTVTVNLIGVNKVDITVAGVSAKGDGYYTGGILIEPISGATRFITAHIGDIITINRPINGLMKGISVHVYPGCDHLKETCNTKFNNLDNFGGFPFIPRRNPFNGSSIM